MNWRSEILARLAGEGSGDVFFLPDLTLWYEWHRRRGTLPGDAGASLPAVCRRLGLPVWASTAPWRLELRGISASTTEADGIRTVRYETEPKPLTARWELQADGEWWQTEYPVKSAADLPAARAVVAARTYVLDTKALAALAAGVGEDGVLALELPMRPYSDILHTLLGWQEGLMSWVGEGRDLLEEMHAELEAKMAALVEQVAALPGEVALAPDNLDAHFLSSRAFRQYLAPSYARTTEALHAGGKRLVAHAGGPVRRLLVFLAEAGVDVVEGVAGLPQGDATLAEARAAAPSLGLWGGIPQDLLLPAVHDEDAFAAAVQAAARAARGDSRMLLGVADKVPGSADLGRLHRIGLAIREG